MFYLAAILLTSFDPEISWLPDPGQFMNMVVTMFWWSLALVIALVPIAIGLWIISFVIAIIISLFR